MIYHFFHSFKSLSVSVNSACFLVLSFLLKLCYVRKFGCKEYQRVIKHKHWFYSVLRFPAGTCPRGVTFLEESPGVSVESHLLLPEFWGTKFLGLD